MTNQYFFYCNKYDKPIVSKQIILIEPCEKILDHGVNKSKCFLLVPQLNIQSCHWYSRCRFAMLSGGPHQLVYKLCVRKHGTGYITSDLENSTKFCAYNSYGILKGLASILTHDIMILTYAGPRIFISDIACLISTYAESWDGIISRFYNILVALEIGY